MEDAQARRRDYDRVAQSLVGMRLAAVRYVELDYSGGEGTPEPQYNRTAGVDTLDYGLDLEFEDARTVGFTWGQEFEMYDLDLVEGSVAHEGAAVWDVSTTSRWRSVVGKRVTRVDVQWIEDEEESVVLSGRAARIPLLILRRSILRSVSRDSSSSPLAEPVPSGLGIRARLGRRLLDWNLRNRGEIEVRQRLFPLAACLHFDSRRAWVAILEVLDDGSAFHCGDTVTVVFEADVAQRLGLSV